jgi:aspartate-semialdehyde dehydrogenase
VEAQFKFGDAVPKVYAKPIAFNVLPAIDVLAETGHCYEEEKMVRETRKIMNLPSLEVLATTARVPTYHCHCEAVHVRLENKTSREQALEVLGSAPGIVLYKDNNHALLPTPRDVTNDSKVHIARVRTPLDTADSHWLQMWIVADNLKKGAATNAVQILELIS